MHDYDRSNPRRDQESKETQRLAGPRMPADRGLTSLGLLMQLSGSLYLGFMLLLGATLLFADSDADGVGRLLMFFAISAVRSGFHRAAGATLIYGSPPASFRDPFDGIRMYIVIAFVHTLLCAWLLKPVLPDTSLLVSALALLAAWPVTLAVVVRLPAFAVMSAERPRSEDLGLEGASVLMLILGTVGALFSGLLLFSVFKSAGPSDGFTKLAMIVISGVLVVRSCAHVLAGKRGLSGSEREVAVAAIRRYIKLSKLSAAVVGILGAMVMMRLGSIFFSFVWIGALIFFLLIWPFILDQFLDRYEIDVGMGSHVYRAPDAGLTALGWLLLALGATNLVHALAPLLLDIPEYGAGLIAAMDAWDMAPAGHSPWLFLAVSGLQLWAAIELCAMSSRARLAASIYGGVTIALTLYVLWPVLRELGGFHDVTMALGNENGFQRIAQLGLALVIPVAAIVLANLEGFAVQARARYRSDGDHPPE
jgi:hypothetical protein